MLGGFAIDVGAIACPDDDEMNMGPVFDALSGAGEV
jgi:hypothetical protein